MADPLSMAAIAALIYTGRKLSENNPPPPEEVATPSPSSAAIDIMESQDNLTTLTNTFAGRVDNMGSSGIGVRPDRKKEMPSFGDVAFMKHVNGEPVHDFRNRPWVSGKMSNFAPNEKQLVGPGLGVGADVPAYGGYQQLFRVKPTNVGAYRLTTLPGRSGPAVDVTGGRPGVVGELTHNKPSDVAYLPSRRPQVRGRAQGQGGALTGTTGRGKYEKTKRPTNRSEYTYRGDGLGFGGARSYNTALTQSQDPSRNKGDMNIAQLSHVDNPAPGIHSFHGAFTNSAAVEMMNGKNGRMYSAEELQKHGFRVDDKRGNKGRSGNSGRMNVRADPLNQGGLVTNVRADTTRVDGRTGPANGGWSQNYIQNEFYQLNPYKGNFNDRVTSKGLSTAKNQLKNNPFAHDISG